MKRICACTLTILISLMNPTPLLNLLTLGYTRLENESELAFLLSICDRLWENRTFGGEIENLVLNILKYIKLPLKLITPCCLPTS